MQPNDTSRGYYRIYSSLVEWLLDDSFLNGIGLLYLLNYVAVMPLVAIVCAGAARDWSDIGWAAQFLIGYPAVLTFVYFMAHVIWSNSRNPVQLSPGIAAYLLLGAYSPFDSSSLGFQEEDLRKLSRVAEVEQGSADWRGNYLNVVILGIAAIFLGFILDDSTTFIEEAVRIINTRLSPSPSTSPTALNTGAMVVLPVLALVSGVIFLKLFRYIKTFLGSETANRIVLIACEEALAYLERKRFAPGHSMSKAQRYAAALHFGYRLSPDRPRKTRQPLPPVIITDMDEVAYLVPFKLPSDESMFSVRPNNKIGRIITIGGNIKNVPLSLAATPWRRYGKKRDDGWARDGRLYVRQGGKTCTIATFLVHVKRNNSGYLHLMDTTPEPHTIWLEVKPNFRKEQQFAHTGSSQELWVFQW